jgi:hypothetical protein
MKWALDLIQADAPNKITFGSDSYLAERLCKPVGGHKTGCEPTITLVPR